MKKPIRVGLAKAVVWKNLIVIVRRRRKVMKENDAAKIIVEYLTHSVAEKKKEIKALNKYIEDSMKMIDDLVEWFY